MPFASLLSIYDPDTMATRAAEFRRNSDMKQVAVKGGIKGLQNALEKLRSERWVFQGAVFSTHGAPGRIRVNDDRIYSSTLREDFANRGYESLFQILSPRIYFDGCNVAEGDAGWEFLETAASIFLRSTGGVAFGYTSVGFGMHPIVMAVSSLTVYRPIAGHTIHPWGESRYAVVGRGGHVVKREVGNEPSYLHNPTPRLP